MEDGFQCLRPELGALLVKGRGGRGIRLQAKEIEQLYPGAGRTAGNQEGDEPVSSHFSGTGEVPAGTGCILGDVGYDMVDGVSKGSFDINM